MNLFGMRSIILFVAFQPVQWQGIIYVGSIFSEDIGCILGFSKMLNLFSKMVKNGIRELGVGKCFNNQ